MPYLQAYHNSLLVTYGGESQEYYFGGNPVVQDETYLTARNAFNNQNGDTISRLVYAQIRNAGSGKFTIRNLETGEVYEERLLDANSLEGAYFSVNEEKWYNTQRSIRVKWNGQDAQGNPLPGGNPGGALPGSGAGILPECRRHLRLGEAGPGCVHHPGAHH